MSDPYRFESCELHVGQRRLLIDGAEAALGGRAFDLLSLLVAQRQRPVPKAELLDAVWPGLDVEEGNLPVQISALRKLLGPHAIATVPGRGYRFTLPVRGDATAPTVGLAMPADDSAPRQHNLPPASTSLIGRDRDLAEALATLQQHALLSLVGTGGIGKTRLALAVARDSLPRYRDGVWWVDLADLDDATRVAGRVGQALGLAAERSPDPVQALAHGLQARELLLVLDNGEHVLDGVAALLQTLLPAAPALRCLLTTQQPLKLGAEQVLRPAPLPVPPLGTGLSQALRYGAVSLLLERARAHDRRFVLTDQTVAMAIAVCEQLDGLPLALEMAAARLPWMGWAGVHDRLGDRLRLLSSDQRNTAGRHRSLQAALDWSHSLLSPAEQRVFRRLALFQGGFTLDVAAEVAADGHVLDRWDVIDALGVLVDKSLVQVEHARASAEPSAQPSAQAGEGSGMQPAALRYRLLESTRLFAQGLLDEAGERVTTQARHAQACGAVAAHALQQLWVLSDAAWLAGHEAEFDNLRAALGTAVQAGHATLAVDLYETLNWLGVLLAGGLEARRWADRMLALAEPSDGDVLVRLLHAVGSVYVNPAPMRAIELMRRALAAMHSGEQGDDGQVGGSNVSSAGSGDFSSDGRHARRYRLHCSPALCLARTGQPDAARQDLAAAQRLLHAQWPARLRLMEADAAGFVAVCGGDLSAAQGHFNRFQALARQAGVTSALNTVAHNLADIALQLGDAAEAVRQGRSLVAALRRQVNDYHLGFALGNLAAALLQTGAVNEAHAAAAEALPHLRREDNALWLFDHLALLALHLGQADVAARLLGHVDAGRQARKQVRDTSEAQARQRVHEGLGQRLPQARLAALMNEGAGLGAEQADSLFVTLAR